MDKTIEAALQGVVSPEWIESMPDALHAITNNPEAMDLLASDPDRPMNQPAAVKVAAAYYYRRLAAALSSTGEEQRK